MIIYNKGTKFCYNHIVHFIASIVMQRLGMLVKPLKCMFNIIQEITHSIRNAFGDSEISIYSKEEEKPNQGILQGKRVGPITWISINTP